MPQRTLKLAPEQGRVTLPSESGAWLDRIADSLYPAPSAELLQPHLIADGHLDRWVEQHRAIVREIYAAIVEYSTTASAALDPATVG